MIYSLAGICSKIAAEKEFLSIEFLMYYGLLIIIMMFYAVVWQQILKKMKLVTAYANKAITILWGLIWGVLFFDESITYTKLLGVMVIILGVYFVVTGEEDKTCT